MSKKELDRRRAKQLIHDSREVNKTDQEIYNELIQLYFDKKAIALLITGTPTVEDKKRFKMLNNILITALSLTFIINILSLIGMVISTKSLELILILIFPLLSAYFIYEISKYNAPIYRFCGIMTIISFARTLTNSNSSGIDILIASIFAFTIAGLAFYLDSKMFPNYSPRNLREDSNGNFML